MSRSSGRNDLLRRTEAIEARVNEIHHMLQKRHATASPADADNGVIMLPEPRWRTMNGVPPIPNHPIEQTGGRQSSDSQWRSARNPAMWPYSPQNRRRSFRR